MVRESGREIRFCGRAALRLISGSITNPNLWEIINVFLLEVNVCGHLTFGILLMTYVMLGLDTCGAVDEGAVPNEQVEEDYGNSGKN